MAQKFIYRGISFPFRKGVAGIPRQSVDDEVVGDSIRQIIGTAVGERVHRPTFGGSPLMYVFENNNEALLEVLRFDIMDQLTRYEPRAVIRDIAIARDTAEQSKLIVTVRYSVLATGTNATTSTTIQ